MKTRYGLDLKKKIVGGGKMKQTGNTFGGLLVCLKILAFFAGAKNGSTDVIKDSKILGDQCSVIVPSPCSLLTRDFYLV